MPPKRKPRKQRPLIILGQLVPISAARLKTWISRRDISAAEVARRAGMRPQKLHHILKGNVARVREGYLSGLATALNVSVPFLRGDPDAPGPGGSTTVFAPMPAPEPDPNAEQVRPGHASKHFESEREAVLADVARVFPFWYHETVAHLAKTKAEWEAAGVYDMPIPTVEEALRKSNFGPTSNQLTGSYFFLGLQSLQRVLAGGAVMPPLPTSVSDEFATHAARVISAVLEPWTSGRAPVPPVNERMVLVITRLALLLGKASINYLQPNPQAVDDIVAEIEAMTLRLDTALYPKTSRI